MITLTSIEPATPFAGPGIQKITLHGTGFVRGYNAAFAINNPMLVSDNTTQGHNARMDQVSDDGTSAIVGIDFGGIVTTWQASVIAPYLNQESPVLLINTLPGVAPAYDPGSMLNQLLDGNFSPVPAIARTALQVVNGKDVVVMLDAECDPSVPDGNGGVTSQSMVTATPGLWFCQPGGRWTFTPVAALTPAMLDQFFPGLLTISPDLEVDPFGLPLPSAARPQDIAWVDKAGNTVVSPWFREALAGATDGTPRTPTEISMQQVAPPAPGPATLPHTGTVGNTGGTSQPPVTVTPPASGGGSSGPAATVAPVPGATAPAKSNGQLIMTVAIVVVLVVVLMKIVQGGK